MPDTREKLIELLAEHCHHKAKRCVGCDPGKHYHPECKTEQFGKIADHLIANGVTIEKLIPVTERLPEENGSYLVATERGGVFITHYWVDGQRFSSRGGRTVITHWKERPLPPKED